MLGFFFSSKNKKLALKLQKEHKKMVELAGEILKAYEDNKPKVIRSKIEKLREIALVHLMKEDIEFTQILRDSKRSSEEIESLIKEFQDSFVGIKSALLDFLALYKQEDAVYNQEFLDQFNNIVGVLGQRIEFEENNLYAALKES